MQINDQDIIRTAQQLREEENQQLSVRPWKRRQNPFPAWLTAIPAAALIGFLFGVWTDRSLKKDTPLTALTDTVYIKVHETPATSLSETDIPTTTRQEPQPASVIRHKEAVRNNTKRKEIRNTPAPIGHPMSEDNIRYDLLASHNDPSMY